MNPTNKIPVLTIDGPAGSGKGTVGQIVAARLGWHYLDSGALYRVLAVAMQQVGCRPNDGARLTGLVESLDIRFETRADGEAARVRLAGVDVTAAVRSEACGRLASEIAAQPAVRAALLLKQRAFCRPPGLVADGRDMGTTVFPDAVLKIFLTASPDIRAERRYKQLKQKGFDDNLEKLTGEIRERDRRDAERAASPLTPAVDAETLDTSRMTIDEVVETILARLRSRLPY
jgi:cytidylate kinase